MYRDGACLRRVRNFIANPSEAYEYSFSGIFANATETLRNRGSAAAECRIFKIGIA